MPGNTLTGLSYSRSSTVALAVRNGQHALYIVPYAADGTAAPTAATDYTELVFSAFEVAATNNGSDLTRIDRVVVPQRGSISYDPQDLFIQAVSGDPLLMALITRAVTNETSAKAGEKMAFWRFFNDRAFYEGELLVTNVRQVGDLTPMMVISQPCRC